MLTKPEKPLGYEKNTGFDDTKNYKKKKRSWLKLPKTDIDPESRADTSTRADSRSEFVSSNRCEETRLAAFRVQRVLHICLAMRKDPAVRLI